MYSTILFDLDGTLTDPGLGITNSVEFALKKWGIPVENKASLYRFIGPPLKESFMKFYNFSEEDALKSVEYYREYFAPKGIFENTLYENTEKMLQAVKISGKKIVLATSKPEIFAKQILDFFQLTKYFDFIAGASIDDSRSQKSDVIKYALDNISRLDNEKTVMIGDREQDILGAKANKIDSIGVLYGYGSLEELKSAGADFIAETTLDILKLI